MPIARGFVATWFLILAACGGRPTPPDIFQKSDYRMPLEQRLRIELAAPVVVIGRVEKATALGNPKRSAGDPRVMVELTKVTVGVEQVLRGAVNGKSLSFYYYTFSRHNERDLGIPRYLPVVGERRIFFLRSFEDGYRSVGDVADYTLPVRSGYHERDFCIGKSLGCCIAENLLVPGADYDPGDFASEIASGQYITTVLCSRKAAVELVRRLESNPDKRISGEASELLRAARADGEL